MIKVVCIDNNNYKHCLTLNKIYDVESFDDRLYLILSENYHGDDIISWKKRFISLDDYREKQLDKLGICN